MNGGKTMNLDDYFNVNTSNDSSSTNTEITIAQLAVLGGLLATVGDAIATYASVLALEGLQQSQNSNSDSEDRINELEKQVKYLTKELHRQKNEK